MRYARSFFAILHACRQQPLNLNFSPMLVRESYALPPTAGSVKLSPATPFLTSRPS